MLPRGPQLTDVRRRVAGQPAGPLRLDRGQSARGQRQSSGPDPGRSALQRGAQQVRRLRYPVHPVEGDEPAARRRRQVHAALGVHRPPRDALLPRLPHQGGLRRHQAAEVVRPRARTRHRIPPAGGSHDDARRHARTPRPAHPLHRLAAQRFDRGLLLMLRCHPRLIRHGDADTDTDADADAHTHSDADSDSHADADHRRDRLPARDLGQPHHRLARQDGDLAGRQLVRSRDLQPGTPRAVDARLQGHAQADR